MGGPEAKPQGVTVTTVRDGKPEDFTSPPFDTPEGEAFWKPVLDEVRDRLIKRGIADTSVMIGIGGDRRPNKGVVEFFFKLAPYAKWVLHTHAGPDKIGPVEVGYKAHVWNVRPVEDPQRKRSFGWKNPRLETAFLREGCKLISGLHVDSPMPLYHVVSESMLLANLRGFGRLGADFWPVLKGPRGSASTLSGRYEKTNWAQLNLTNSAAYVLGAGPDGPVATVRLEMLREGLLEAEARIAIEKVLTEPAARARLGEEPAERYQRLLDDRAKWIACVYSERSIAWFSGPTWRQMAEQLFAAAGEVAAKLKPREKQ